MHPGQTAWCGMGCVLCYHDHSTYLPSVRSAFPASIPARLSTLRRGHASAPENAFYHSVNLDCTPWACSFDGKLLGKLLAVAGFQVPSHWMLLDTVRLAKQLEGARYAHTTGSH